MFQETGDTYRIKYTPEGQQYIINYKAKESEEWVEVPLSEERLTYEVAGHLCTIKEGKGNTMQMQYVY